MKSKKIWFLTGSQNLYGDDILKQVDKNVHEIISGFNQSGKTKLEIVLKPVLTNAEAIHNVCHEANANETCVGVICWMHTFSPAKMWVAGLNVLAKPLVHLHTQFNRDIPWNEIDMDFMNLNQSAHGGREFGFINARMRKRVKVIAGHWKDEDIRQELDQWMRVALAWSDAKGGKVARFGDNMRNVAVTEGDKVETQIKLGYTVHGFGIGDLVDVVNKVSDKDTAKLIEEYHDGYKIDQAFLSETGKKALHEAARIELGMRNFLEEGGFNAFTTNFEDLHGLKQLPGLAVQRLMAEGYGFGAEGDWKTAALVRAVKVMADGLTGGTSFMEDYTYHFEPGNEMVLGAHMLEVCSSLAAEKPALEVHPLGIGGKDDPCRLVFNVAPGKGLNASLMDMGNRLRLLINNVDVVAPRELPKLPVARVLWKPLPDLKTAAQAWILAGGAHHTAFTMAVDASYLEDFAEIAGIETLKIDKNTKIDDFKKEIRLNEVYFHLNNGFQ